MNRLSPLLVRDANNSHILDLGMSAKNLLDLGRIDILPAADDHVALAVGEIIAAFPVATGHVAGSTIRAAKRLSGLLWQVPIALKRVWRARIKLTDFSVAALVNICIT